MYHSWQSLVTFLVGENSTPNHDMFMATVYAAISLGMLVLAYKTTHIDYKGMTKWEDNGLMALAGIFILLGIGFIFITLIAGIDMIFQFGNQAVV